jgi:hypothetical protein
MIKFFRKIRYDLMEKNKTGKPAYRTGRYFKYAIGEIVLVVIGILIALQINNWNENKKKTKIGLQYLTEMISDLQNDVLQLDFYINKLKQSIKNQEAALNTKDISKLSIDSLSMIINSTNLDFKTSELTFNKMNNLGITSLSNNDSLNLKITEYYNRDMVRLKLGINYIFNDLLKRTDFYLYEQNKIDLTSYYTNQKFLSLYNQSEEELEKEFKTNTIGFIQSIKGRNIVIYNLSGKKYSLSLLNRFKQKTTTLLKAIYDELKIYDPKIKSLPTYPSEVE